MSQILQLHSFVAERASNWSPGPKQELDVNGSCLLIKKNRGLEDDKIHFPGFPQRPNTSVFFLALPSPRSAPSLPSPRSEPTSTLRAPLREPHCSISPIFEPVIPILDSSFSPSSSRSRRWMQSADHLLPSSEFRCRNGQNHVSRRSDAAHWWSLGTCRRSH